MSLSTFDVDQTYSVANNIEYAIVLSYVHPHSFFGMSSAPGILNFFNVPTIPMGPQAHLQKISHTCETDGDTGEQTESKTTLVYYIDNFMGQIKLSKLMYRYYICSGYISVCTVNNCV